MGSSQRSTAAISQQAPARSRKVKASLKSSTIAIYASIFALVIVIVGLGYHEPQQESTVVNASADISASFNSYSEKYDAVVDDTVATNIAADVAAASQLPVAIAVANLAYSSSIKNEYSAQLSLSKSQILNTTERIDSINYTVVDGDTMDSIANKFSLSKNTIKWANHLSTDSISSGKVLKIPPIDGVVYTVKSGDTIDSISKKYKVDKTRLILFNDLENSSFNVGDQLMLPAGLLPSNERPGYVNYRFRFAPGYSGGNFTVINNPDTSNYVPSLIPGIHLRANTTNAGYNGQCTWYVYWRRAAIGRPIPNMSLGNAERWNTSLAGRFLVNDKPEVGAIIQNGIGAGHVGVVEAINGDGSLLISEMNNASAGGNYVVDTRTIPSYAINSFNYIH